MNIISIIHYNKQNIFLCLLFSLIYKNYNYFKNKKNKIATLLYILPYVNENIKKELKKQTLSLQNSLNNNIYNNFVSLPDESLDEDKLNSKMDVLDNNILKSDNISGVIYCNNEYDDIICNFYKKYSKMNPLHADLYPQIRMMEIDIINICKNLYKAPSNSCGSLTSGGTESILLACLTYRDYCKENKNIVNPNIVAFETVHPAFDKACHYFNIKLIKVVSLRKMKSCLNSNTICLVASAPDYSYGIIDPIAEISDLAIRYNINLHIDACMGGFLLPFIDEFSNINFEHTGITSISMDSHKYGYAPKGSSVLLFRDYKIKKYQHFVSKDWCGGVYATPTMLGSKPGGIIAGTWASLLLRGRDNFVEISNKINKNFKYIVDEINKNEYVEIIGDPLLNIVAVKSQTLNIYMVINEMKEKGWKLSVMQNPPAFHFCVTDMHSRETCTKLCNDLNNSCCSVKNNTSDTKLEGTLAIYGGENNLEKSLFVDEIIHDYIFLLSQNSIAERYN